MEIKLLEPQIPEESKEYVNDCIDTGWISYSGDYVKLLEDQVKCFVRSESAVAMGSGTGALWMILETLGIGPGDFVVVPTMTFVATVNAVTHTGATPVFVGCDDNLQMDVSFLKQAVDTLKPKAIIPVHMLGNTCDMEAIKEIAQGKDHTAFIIEDATQALGSRYLNTNKKVGCYGIASMFSFSFNKIIAAGQGGMAVTNHLKLGKQLKYLSLQAKDNAEMYKHDESGFNMGMSNLNAALACGQMEYLSETLKQKRRVRDKYVELLGEENMYYQEGGNGWLNAYRSEGRNYRDISDRCKEAGIQTRPLFFPNHLQESFRGYPYFGDDLAVDKYWSTVCIPSSQNLTDEQIKYVVKSIRGDK